MENLLSDLLKLLIELIIVKPLLAIFRFVRFCVTTAAIRRQMLDYKRFTRNEFTSRGKRTPTLILRIENGYIRKYNQAATYWAGRMLMMKTYPEADGESHRDKRLIQRPQQRSQQAEEQLLKFKN